jgi:PHP family Zn ribbon phosphoesterase
MTQILNISISPTQPNGRSFYIKNIKDETIILKPNSTAEVSKETADNLVAMYSSEIKILEDIATDSEKKPAKNK